MTSTVPLVPRPLSVLHTQRGITLIGLLFVVGIVAVLGVVALKVVPTVLEYQAINKAIMSIRSAGTTPKDIQTAFDKQANVGYIESITGKDLTIVRNGTAFDISFAYDKKIPLVGPASLLMEYEGTTVTTAVTKKAVD
ncbi:MAG: DUF4845 domain-containing protein [Pseudomonadota bacterium]